MNIYRFPDQRFLFPSPPLSPSGVHKKETRSKKPGGRAYATPIRNPGPAATTRPTPDAAAIRRRRPAPIPEEHVTRLLDEARRALEQRQRDRRAQRRQATPTRRATDKPMPSETTPAPPRVKKRGMLATLVRTLLFHVLGLLNGLLLVALLVLTAGGVGLLLLCTFSASTRSSRLFVAWLWRNELWINGVVGDKQTEPERRELERARGLRREASQQGGRMALPTSVASSTANSTASATTDAHSLPRSSSTRGREVTKTVMAFSVLYFLLFKGFFNVMFATVPLTLWGIVTIHIVPSLAPDNQALMADNTTGRVFVALATSVFAYQIGVAAASMSVYVSEKVQELLFHRDTRRSSVRSPLLASDSFRQAHSYMEHTQSMQRDMFSFDERDELLHGRDRAGSSGVGSSGAATGRPSSASGPPPPPPPPPPPHGAGFQYDGFRPMAPIPPIPGMPGDPRGQSTAAYERAYQAEPVSREVEFCGVKVTIQTQPEEVNRMYARSGGRGSGSFRGFPHRGGGGRGRSVMGRGGLFHPGMSAGIIEPPMAYGSFGLPYDSSEQVPEVFARVVSEDEQVRQPANRARPLPSPVFGRSCSSSPRGQRSRGGRKGGGRYRRSDSFDSGQPGGGRFAPDVDLKHGAHTRLWEALDLRPSAPNFPEAYPVGRPPKQYPSSPSGFYKTQSDDGYRGDHGYTDDSDTPSGFRKFEMFATKQKLKEQSRQLKEAAKRLKREFKEQYKREAKAAQARSDEHERFAAEQQRYAAEQARYAREYAKQEERRAKDLVRSARALGQKQSDTQLKQAEVQQKQVEDQRKQAEDQRRQADDQRRQAEDQRRLDMEASAARAVEQQLKYQASPAQAISDEPKRDASRVEELSASYRERAQEIQARDEYAIEIQLAAEEEVERQRRELEAVGQPPDTKPFSISQVTSSDSAAGRESGRLRGRRSTNSSDHLVGVSALGLNDPDFVSRSRRMSSSRSINVANIYQADTEYLDTDIHATWGSVSRSDDDVMGLHAYAGMSLPSSPALVRGLQSPRYRAVVGGYDQMSPLTSPTNSFMANSFVDAQYDQLSSTSSSLHDADFPSEEFQQVYRSIRYTDENRVVPSQLSALPHYEDVPGQRDKVHFCSYAPPSVFPSKKSFRFSVWAFLLNQRNEMRERAEAADPDAQQLSINTKLVVRRGAIVHVTLEAPSGFKILNGATQGFPWEGKISNVGYDIECTEHADFGQVLFKASIVVGTEVAVLRSYVIVSSRKLDPGELEAKLLDSELEVLQMTFNEVPYPSLELKEFVGSGYFGDAYRASYNGQDVVVKTIRASEFGETNDQILKEFQHEAAVLSMFGHHPCVVPFVGASTDMRYPLSLITKYLPFGSLEDTLKKPEMNSALTTRQRTSMLKDAAAGLLNIHEGGFIHRDVAARNCLVDSDLGVKICDFGLCRRVNAYGGSLMKDSVGPIKYMAPESLQPPHSFSYESDAWMFGVLMWETYTATPPFQNKTPIQAGMAVLGGERLPVPKDLPTDLQELMEACFHEVPSERPSMAQILEELDRATAPRPLGKSRLPLSSGPMAMATAATGSGGHAPPRGLGRHDLPIQV